MQSLLSTILKAEVKQVRQLAQQALCQSTLAAKHAHLHTSLNADS
jgi:hypothetical protein